VSVTLLTFDNSALFPTMFGSRGDTA
jgi:hypothetical protein